ncbi:MAG: DUF4411 family protein [Sedimenticola sp.]
MKYLLDANTLIEAKNRYYNMKVCPGFWDWLLLSSISGDIASISLVFDELKRGNDELKEWAILHGDLFLDVADEPTQQAFAEIAQHVSTEAHKMKVGAMEDFLSGADPWLIAMARASGMSVVTHEAYNPDIKKKFLIPNICHTFDVPYIDTFELLLTLEAEFVLAA